MPARVIEYDADAQATRAGKNTRAIARGFCADEFARHVSRHVLQDTVELIVVRAAVYRIAVERDNDHHAADDATAPECKPQPEGASP